MTDTTLPTLGAAPSVATNTKFLVRRSGQTADESATGTQVVDLVAANITVPTSLADLTGDTDDVNEGVTNLYFTNERAQDAVGGMVDATLVYTDGTPALGRAAISGDITIAAGSNTAAIGAGVIVDADISGSAAITLSKLATLTASRALASDGSGRISVSSVTATELGYVSGVTSAIQTQLNGKQAQSSILDNTTASFTTADETKLDYITVTQAVDLDAIETRVNALDAAVVLKGTWDASAGTFPGSGSAQAGESWIVSVGGTVNGQVFVANDRIIAITDNASTTTFAANWFKADYTDQVLSVAGKTGAVTLDPADITGLTASAAELNILDGATLSTTELNYVDGVTSAIQTQLNGKAATGQTGGISLTMGGTIVDGTYTIYLKLPFGITITETTSKCTSGTATATFKINTTALGGTANSVSSSEQSQSHASANVASTGDDLVVTISSASSLTDPVFSLTYTRTLA